MNLRGERWKEYPLDENRINKEFRLFFSNLGRVKSYSRNCKEGRILKGSLREGYPIVSAKLMTERKGKTLSKVEDFNLKIQLLQNEIRELKMIKDMPQDLVEERANDLKFKKEELIKQRQVFTLKTEKKRTINFHILVHRAIAELFLEKGEQDEVVIHKDFVKTNNVLSNLEWKSKEEA
jgi:hypothetical protein